MRTDALHRNPSIRILISLEEEFESKDTTSITSPQPPAYVPESAPVQIHKGARLASKVRHQGIFKNLNHRRTTVSIQEAKEGSISTWRPNFYIEGAVTMDNGYPARFSSQDC